MHEVQPAVEKALPALGDLASALVERMKQGGRLFYLGAGTSGRLGIVDASECPYIWRPTLVVGLMAGGDAAIRKAVEGAEDDEHQGWTDLEAHEVTKLDTVVGIAASGRTPYVLGALRQARLRGLLTGCITCNPESAIVHACDHPVVAVTGPEFVTGSSDESWNSDQVVAQQAYDSDHDSAGTRRRQPYGRHATHQRQIGPARRMVSEATGLDLVQAQLLLEEHGSVRQR